MSNDRRRVDTRIDTRRDQGDDIPLTEKRDPPRPWPPPPQPQDSGQSSQGDDAGDSSDSGPQKSED